MFSFVKSDSTALFEILTAIPVEEKSFIEHVEKLGNIDLSNLRDNRLGYECKTLLHHACRVGNLRIARYLVNKGHAVDVFDTSVQLKTPLMLAIEHGHIDVAAYLVQSSASLSIQDVRMENALHYAARSSCRMVKSIIKASGLDNYQLQSIASVTNIKLLFPEDVAAFSITKENLVCLRERGCFLVRKRKPVVERIPNYMKDL